VAGVSREFVVDIYYRVELIVNNYKLISSTLPFSREKARFIASYLSIPSELTRLVKLSSSNKNLSITGPKMAVETGEFYFRLTIVRTMGIGRGFSMGAPLGDFFKSFLGGPKVAKFVFSHSKLRKQPFLLKFSKSRWATPHCLPPPSYAHG